MSDAKKGSRDISELKQRLGLKKQAGSTTGSTQRVGNQSGGVVAPPGMNLPPPPGVQPPQPPPPPPINAAEDPFGAMSAMATAHAPQRAPEIVIVNDGRPVENVGQQSTGAVIARIAVPAVIALIIGLAVGKISGGANAYNDGIDGAKAILANNTAIKKDLSELEAALDDAKTRNNYKPDPKTDAVIKAAAAKLEIKKDLYNATRNVTLENDLAGQVLGFYAGVTELKSILDGHAKSAKTDEQQLLGAKKSLEDATAKEQENKYLAATGALKYAIVITAPASCGGDDKEVKKDCELQFGANFVELGGPICGSSKIPAAAGKCNEGESLAGFGYRADPGSTSFQTAEVITQGNDSVPSRKIIPLVPNGVIDAFVKKNENSASEILYTRRLKQMSEMTKKLIETANNVEKGLTTFSNSGKRFTFFM